MTASESPPGRLLPAVPRLRAGIADLSAVRLHYVEAGEGPLVVLLHGFPEFWYGWRHQIGPLVEAGFRVVAPDLRGYNRSGKPPGIAAYRLERLAADVRDLVAERGGGPALVAGHDWGAITGWALAAEHPEAVSRLVVMNGPHPRQLARRAVRDPAQLARLWYAGAFQVPWLPERALAAAGHRVLREGLVRTARPGAFTDEDLSRYAEAWSQPGALTAMLHYYRAAARRAPWAAGPRQVRVPVRVVWGERDAVLSPELAEPSRDDVPNLERVFRLDASHWVQHDQPQRVAELLVEFFSGS